MAAAGRCHHRRVGVAAEVRNELSHMRLALRRLAYGTADATLGAGAEGSWPGYDRLDRLLLAPMPPSSARAPLWWCRPASCTPRHGRPAHAGRAAVSVAPSARLWLTPAGAPSPAARAEGKNGPHRRGRRSRAGRCRTRGGRYRVLYPSAQVLTGQQADVASVSTALEGAGIAMWPPTLRSERQRALVQH